MNRRVTPSLTWSFERFLAAVMNERERRGKSVLGWAAAASIAGAVPLLRAAFSVGLGPVGVGIAALSAGLLAARSGSKPAKWTASQIRQARSLFRDIQRMKKKDRAEAIRLLRDLFEGLIEDHEVET